MKQKTLSLNLTLAAVLLLSLCSRSIAQSGDQEKQIIRPFDSVEISEVKAVGNLAKGAIHVSMQVKSNYHKLAALNFVGGAFGDFGVIDDKGVQYKYSSYEGPGGINSNVNNGFARISDLEFGKSKVQILISVQDTLINGQSKSLSFRLAKADTSIKVLKEVHIRVTLLLNYMSAGQKMVSLKNIPVSWFKPSKTPIKKSA